MISFRLEVFQQPRVRPFDPLTLWPFGPSSIHQYLNENTTAIIEQIKGSEEEEF